MNDDQARVLLTQIGARTFLAVSGGRFSLNTDGHLVLPVTSGYTVEVELVEGRDTYTVRRVFRRGVKSWVKGELEDVYCEDVSEVVWQAHAFRSYDFPEGATA